MSKLAIGKTNLDFSWKWKKKRRFFSWVNNPLLNEVDISDEIPHKKC